MLLGWLFRGRALGWLGLATFVLFLAPPLLTRAAISVWNFPTLRQLYLPILLGGPLMMAAWLQPSGARPRAGGLLWTSATFAWLAVLTLQSFLSAGHSGSDADRARVTQATAALLEGASSSTTVVGIGDETCGIAPSLIRSGPSIRAIPAGHDDADPQLEAIGPNSLIASVANGFDIPAHEDLPKSPATPGPGPSWITLTQPPLLREGSQRISGGTVTIFERAGDRITALRYDFESPLRDMAFLRFRGCESPFLASVRHAKGPQ